MDKMPASPTLVQGYCENVIYSILSLSSAYLCPLQHPAQTWLNAEPPAHPILSMAFFVQALLGLPGPMKGLIWFFPSSLPAALKYLSW